MVDSHEGPQSTLGHPAVDARSRIRVRVHDNRRLGPDAEQLRELLCGLVDGCAVAYQTYPGVHAAGRTPADTVGEAIQHDAVQ